MEIWVDFTFWVLGIMLLWISVQAFVWTCVLNSLSHTPRNGITRLYSTDIPCFIALHRHSVLFLFLFFYKLKVCNNPSSGESASTIFPTFAHFVSYFGNFPNISNFFIIMLQWSLKLLLQLGKGSDESWHVLAAIDVLIKIYTWFFRPNAIAHFIEYLWLLLF